MGSRCCTIAILVVAIAALTAIAIAVLVNNGFRTSPWVWALGFLIGLTAHRAFTLYQPAQIRRTFFGFRRITDMNLSNQMAFHGRMLFRWRSYFPAILFVALAFVGSFQFTFFLGSHAGDEIWDVGCLLLAIFGLLVRIATVSFVPRGTSGRNTRRIKASTLNTTGMYSVMRHPLYLANFIIFMSFVLFFHQPLLAIIGAVLYWVCSERVILAEEMFLREQFGVEFEAWAARTPTFWPRWRNWQSPKLPPCWRSVVRREYTTCFLIILVFFFLEVIGHARVEGRLVVEWPWAALIVAGLAIYLSIRTVKHCTPWLESAGR